MIFAGGAMYNRYAITPLTNADIDRVGKFFTVEYEKKMKRKHREFGSREFDIQQILKIDNTDYSSTAVGCRVLVPGTTRDFGQAFLFNAVTDMGYWYQIGISQGFAFDTLEDKKFGIIYQASGPNGKVLFETTQLKNSIEPVREYDISIRLKGSSVIAEVRDSQGKLLKSIDGPSFGSKRFVGSEWRLKNGERYFTGAMTEIISASRDVKTGSATYIIAGSNLAGIGSFALTANMGASDATRDMSGKHFDYTPGVHKSKSGKTTSMSMGNYVESLVPMVVEANGKKMDGYSFTTSSSAK